jgi:hypothetical protein
MEEVKQEFFNEYFQAIKEESYMVKEEGEQCDRIVRSGYVDLGGYMEGVRVKIERKLEMFNELRRRAEYFVMRLNEVSGMGRMVGEQMGFDEQLLDGLPGDDFGGRLF